MPDLIVTCKNRYCPGLCKMGLEQDKVPALWKVEHSSLQAQPQTILTVFFRACGITCLSSMHLSIKS